MAPCKLKRSVAIHSGLFGEQNVRRKAHKTTPELGTTFEPALSRPLSKRKSQAHWVHVARWGRPSTVEADNVRPWPVGVLRPSDVRVIEPPPHSHPLEPARVGRSSPERCSTRARVLASALSQDLWPEDLGAGSDVLRGVAVDLDRGFAHLCGLLRDLEIEESGRDVVGLDDPFERIETCITFLHQGGDVPSLLPFTKTCLCSGAFASEVSRFIGCFLVSKQGSGPPRPRRAAWAIRGSSGGRVALQRLAVAGIDDLEIRRLGVPDPAAPGGYSADPVDVQRLCWMVTPEALSSWAIKVQQCDLSAAVHLAEHALGNVRLEKQRLAEETRKRSEYERKVAYRAAEQRRRGPLVRELWSALWNAHSGRAQSVFFAMKRIGIYPADKIFHLVIVPGEENDTYVVLEPAGAIAEEADVVLPDRGDPVRKHAAATALEAYECMRLDDKAPAGRADLHRWLQEECPPPSRSQWDVKRFQTCPGRMMMLNQVFEQVVLTDLIDEALEIKVPGEDDDDALTGEASAFFWPDSPGAGSQMAEAKSGWNCMSTSVGLVATLVATRRRLSGVPVEAKDEKAEDEDEPLICHMDTMAVVKLADEVAKLEEMSVVSSSSSSRGGQDADSPEAAEDVDSFCASGVVR